MDDIDETLKSEIHESLDAALRKAAMRELARPEFANRGDLYRDGYYGEWAFETAGDMAFDMVTLLSEPVTKG